MITGERAAHNYEEERAWCRRFLEEFRGNGSADAQHGDRKYLAEVQKVYDRTRRNIEVQVEDLEEFFSGEQYRAFLDGVRRNTRRYTQMFTEVASELPNFVRRRPVSEEEEFEEKLNDHQFYCEKSERDSGKPRDARFAHFLRNKVEVVIVPAPEGKQRLIGLRRLVAANIGALVSVRGMVVRVSEVRPQMEVACYFCEGCENAIYVRVNARTFMPPTECTSAVCAKSRTRGNIVQNFPLSRFVPYQELTVQETADQTPVGAIPRTFSVQTTGANVKQCTPGDVVRIAGILLTRVAEGFRGRRDALTHETYLETLKIEKEKKSFNTIELSADTRLELRKLSTRPRTIDRLAASIAPEIFGMENVKKALLLQMVGGSTLTLGDGMKIRGDINLALIGDPGVAKSQLLKYVAHITPRGVYTTGRGSSGAGLTASVLRDPLSGEVSLEGGALVLADLGVCCIDEFDKMEEGDRVCIHEVMEQQTISLAKAGITTQLNARTSILAAANPPSGRYNRDKSAHENINMPYSLLSRFDLIFILLDTPDSDADDRLARHITHVHQHRAHPQSDDQLLSEDVLRQYIAYARTFNPTIAQEHHAFIVAKYVEMRRLNGNAGAKDSNYITPRTLLGVIRLAQALAKLRFSELVEQEDIVAAIELMDSAQAAVRREAGVERELVRKTVPQDTNSAVFNIIKGFLRDRGEASRAAVERAVIRGNFTPADLARCLESYAHSNVLHFTADIIKLI